MRFTKLHKLLLGLLVVLLFLASIITWLGASYVYSNRHQPPKYGVTFSAKYARELGVDWQEAFLAIIDELNPAKVRLTSYWDEIEPQNNRYKFTDLDWMFTQAQKRGTQISLAVGLRQPRWPECHQPEWVGQLTKANQNSQLLSYLQTVIERYRSNPALYSWQLENEAANSLFGQCPKFDSVLFTKELNLIRQLDGAHPIVTNASNQIGLPLRKPVGERVGFSVYKHATPRIGNSSFRWSYKFVPALWHSFKAQTVESLHNAKVFIHELQAEPWAAQALTAANILEQNELMNPLRFVEYVNYAISTGITEIDLWGVEWWFWRKSNLNDPSMWNVARRLF